MVDISGAPGLVSALSGGHIFGNPGALGRQSVGEGAPFPFAGAVNVPTFPIGVKTPIATAAPKTNTAIPYTRIVPIVNAQAPLNLITASAGEPLFVKDKTNLSTRSTSMASMQSTDQMYEVATLQYFNDKLKTFTTPTDEVIKQKRFDFYQGLVERSNIVDFTDDLMSARLTKVDKEDDSGIGAAAVELMADAVGESPPSFDPKKDWFAVKELIEYRLDGIIRSIDLDGNPLVTPQNGLHQGKYNQQVVNLGDAKMAAAVNVIVQGPAKVRLVESDSMTDGYPPAYNTEEQAKITVFDELVLILFFVPGTSEGEEKVEEHYEIMKSRKYFTTDVSPDSKTENSRTKFDKYKEDDPRKMIGYWRIGRILEEQNRTDFNCVVNYNGQFMLSTKTAFGSDIKQEFVAL